MKADILSKNLMIRASAGSGKTYQLGNRVIGLVGSKDIDPERIVALTFTRKAAGEFADSVLSKLAEAAVDDDARADLFEGVGQKFDVEATLQKVVRALPRFQLGTMDGFFAQVVRGFQYELGLTGGKFDLVQGPKLEAAVSDILSALLVDALEEGEADEFLYAFKRATMGREERRVAELLSEFFKLWQGLWKSGLRVDGLDEAFGPLWDVDAWEEQKRGFVQSLRKTVSTIEWTRKGQDKAYEKLIDAFEMHTIGSGSLGKAGKLFEGIREWSIEGGPMVLKHYKEFTPGPMAEDGFSKMMECLRGCELAAAVERTRAVVDLVRRFDQECERRLRRRGMLGFDDVKLLMGEWVEDEEKRLRREAVDFRLDARYDHWLLDEFQDTSRAEWRGMEPLLDEAASDDQGSLFIVGDTKQAIYGWRGGDVGLFDLAKKRYEGGLEVETMPKSWRSCAAVLDLVNQVCGDKPSIGDLFGAGLAERWPWERHDAAQEGLTGEARVEVVPGKSEERYDRVVELLHELGVGEKALSCGVLVRTNAQLTAISELLRAERFDVIEEGSRKPTTDHPVGVTIYQLIAWLADPSNDFARKVLAMSPLEGVLQERFEGKAARAWEQLLGLALSEGYAAMVEGLLEPGWDEISEFGRRRAGDVIGALAAFDAGGGGSAREALRWITGLEIAQSPGSAAVQVMTVHKSKGLGFDVVILPEIDDGQVPNGGRFQISKGEGWVLQNPASWVRQAYPAIAEDETRWEEEQRYEAMCVLYVALTRAKRGLYVLLPEDKKSREPDWASSANLIRRAVGAEGDGMVFSAGSADWLAEVDLREADEERNVVELASAKPIRGRSTPSAAKAEAKVGMVESATGKVFGSEVHEVFEQVGWVDEDMLELPDGQAGHLVAGLLELPEIRSGFERANRNVMLYREQAVELIVDGKWLSGIVDRLVVGEGVVEVIDFKTDAVDSPQVLIGRYSGQMKAYRQVLEKLYPDMEIRCRLLSTKLREWVEC
ncbi:MAG: UvrD-helicase domain-containing protein [Roseibacillus sp.]|nr:UvrD-helicase domain-containing protein [Roseibacillus sp.]